MTILPRPALGVTSIAAGFAAALALSGPASADVLPQLPPLPIDPPCLPGTVLDTSLMQCVVSTLPPLPAAPGQGQSLPPAGGRSTLSTTAGPNGSPAGTTRKQRRHYSLHRSGHRHRSRR